MIGSERDLETDQQVAYLSIYLSSAGSLLKMNIRFLPSNFSLALSLFIALGIKVSLIIQ